MTQSKILSDSELNIILKSQLSLDKKRKKIHYKPYTIDDCLAEIFMYIPILERRKVAQVCKQWNKALHSNWYRVKRLEFPRWQLRYIHQELKGTNGLLFIKSLINSCSFFLTELDLVGYDNSDIVPFVNETCPNLVKLRLRFRFYNSNDLENAFSCMSKLKILKMIFQFTNGIPSTALDSIKDIDTLTELSLAYWSHPRVFTKIFPWTNSFPDIISRLNNLQKLDITGLLTDTLYESTKTYRTNQLDDNCESIYTVSSRNLTLSSFDLNLMDYEVTDDDLHTFANNIPLLYSIKALSTYVTDVGIQTITMINFLESIQLLGVNQHITDSSIKLLKNLKELRLPYNNKITNASVTKVLENSPNMRWLSIMHTGVTPEFLKKASEIASKRGEYLILCTSFDKNIYSSQEYQLPYLKINHHDKTNVMDKKFCECFLQKESIVNN